jgi:hypothetical protein
MYKLRAGIAGFVTLLILTPGVVLAKNYCIGGFGNPDFVFVGIGFKVPAKGKCTPWTGFVALGANLQTAGVGCTSSDGSNLSLTLTTGDQPQGWAEIDAISLSLPSQTGEDSGQYIASSSVSSYLDTGIVGAACSTNTIPAVTQGGAAPDRKGSQ